jgi:hypothetical protein
MVNALNNRPYDRHAERQMEQALLPQLLVEPAPEGKGEGEGEDGDGDGDAGAVEKEACNPYGIFFIAAIKCDSRVPCPRLHQSICIRPDVFAALTGGCSYDFYAVKGHEATVAACAVAVSNPARVPNKAASTRLVEHLREEDKLVTEIDELEHRLNHVNFDDQGSDLEDEEAPEVYSNALGVNGETSKAFVQFAADLMAKSPNMGTSSSAASYLKFSASERRDQCTQILKRVDLCTIFTCFSIRIASWDEWTRAFDKFWPMAVTPVKGQNWGSMQYRTVWSLLLSRLDGNGQHAVRAAIKAQFNQLRWIPYSDSDRVWHTRYKTGFRHYLGYGETRRTSGKPTTAPLLLANPRFVGEWGIDIHSM